jgi:membrane protein required for colicin V production
VIPEDFPFNLVDAGVGVLILGSALFAFIRGFLRELMSIVGWVGAILIALYSFPYVQPYTRRFIDIEIVADASAAVGVFIAALFVISLAGAVIAKRIKESEMNALDRTLGFAFGAVRGMIVISIAFLLFARLTPPEHYPEMLTDARTLPLLQYGGSTLEEFVPAPVIAQGEEAAADVALRAIEPLTLEEAIRLFFQARQEEEDGGPETTPDSSTESGYKAEERDRLERLIDNNGTEQ